MSVFDTLAENRYQQWLEARQAPDYVAPDPVNVSAAPKSLEGLLWQETLSCLSQASVTPVGAERDALLQRAASLEFQLIIALENKGLPLVARSLRETVRRRCLELRCSVAGNTPLAASQRRVGRTITRDHELTGSPSAPPEASSPASEMTTRVLRLLSTRLNA